MDCEKFDLHVIDALYDELDELTYAALKRHVEGCSRCAAIFSGLRATREVGILPIEEPSDDLEAKIMAAVNVAQKKAPWPRKLLRGLAWAGSHAMRPQLAMAALFFLVIGSSLLLLRGKPGSMGVAVRVSEKGAPAPEQAGAMPPSATASPDPQAYAVAPILAAPTAVAAAGAERPLEQQQIAEGRGQGDDRAKADMEKAPADKAASADKDAARTALADARSVRDTSGCAAAVSKYDEVGVRFPGTGAAADAMWDAASCYKSMGDTAKARELYLALQSGSYKERAAQELASLDAALGNGNMAQNQVAARAPAPKPIAPPAAAPPAKVAADSPAATTSANEAKARPGGGSGGNAPAAPKAQQRVMDSSY
ncbi:MAG: zf-HC2 domain-containing protein [Minicystis sp.]